MIEKIQGKYEQQRWSFVDERDVHARSSSSLIFMNVSFRTISTRTFIPLARRTNVKFVTSENFCNSSRRKTEMLHHFSEESISSGIFQATSIERFRRVDLSSLLSSGSEDRLISFIHNHTGWPTRRICALSRSIRSDDDRRMHQERFEDSAKNVRSPSIEYRAFSFTRWRCFR